MLLLALAYLGGVLTIISPCILPVLPFVFARADRPFLRSGLPILVGMAATFSLVATLAAVGGGWVVQANQYGRTLALGLLAFFGVTLLFPVLAARLAQPLVDLGARLSGSVDASRSPVWPSLLLGVATGLLWAPCAGPILGLILTGAAIQGANVHTTVLLAAYAAGAATSLGLAMLVGGRVFKAMKQSLGAGEWVRRGLGAAVLLAVAAITLGLDTGLLTRVSLASTSAIEERLVDRLRPSPAPAAAMTGGTAMTGGAAMSGGTAMMSGGGMMSAKGSTASRAALAIEGDMPPLDGATQWLNSQPLSRGSLKGKVVLVDFWTYSCINCLRAIPYVRAWDEKYRAQGLVVIGVHTPEFAFERDLGNIKKAVADLKIGYPVAVDSGYAIWRAFGNQFWPAHYFIDATGKVRHHHFGEGGYAESERVLQQLLAEAGAGATPAGLVAVSASGAEAPSAAADVLSPETYVGYERAERFVSPGGAVEDKSHVYEAGGPRLNEWGLTGSWTIGREHARLDRQGTPSPLRRGRRDVPFPRPRSALRSGSRRRQARALPRDPRRQVSGGRSRRRRRRRWQRRGDGPAAVSAHPAAGRSRGPHVRDPLPGSGRRGVRVHIRLIRGGSMSRRVITTLATVGLAAACVALVGRVSLLASAEKGRALPPPAVDAPVGSTPSEVAVLAGGCFWGVQGVYQHVKGVTSAVSGYTGGEKSTAQYERVGTGSTGHAESVKVTFDPRIISYGRVLQIFFSVAHDPTQLNRQGPDVGSQYRSAVFPTSPDQARVAKAYVGQLSQARLFDAAIVTKIEPDRTFYPAEAYHQDFLTLNPSYPYIVVNDLPKIAELKRLFPDAYRDKPVLVGAAR
jgi:methionine-S-sulfoxide reductase